MLWRRLGNKKGTSMAESAITLPIVLLITLFMVNVSMAWYSANAASNAANYGARVGSVSQTNPIGNSVAAAQSQLAGIGVGSYSVSGSGGGFRGAEITVTVDWSLPSYLGSLLSWFGGTDPANFHGTATSSFRQEGW